MLLAGAFWLFLAPPKIGGRSSYVITSGISMEPSFHAGDLAIIRPAARYRVGEIAAYHSTLLHVVVLHRIIAIHGDRYVFKGDNNHFIDPTHPTRSQLIGALWVHIPHGGVALHWLHSPITAAVLCGLVALLLVGTGETKRRRSRRGKRGHGSDRLRASPMTSLGRGAPVGVRSLMIGVAAIAVICAAIAVYAHTRPSATQVSHRVHYTQKGQIAYRASAPAGPVYPGGTLQTGDPIFLQLVHRLAVTAGYHFAVDAPVKLKGTQQVFLALTGPTGWTRQIALSPVRHFTGAAITTPATIDLHAVQALLDQVQRATGIPSSGANVGILMKVRVTGTVAGQPVTESFAPTAGFELQPLELTPAGSPPPAAPGAAGASTPSSETGFTPSATGTVTDVSFAPNLLRLAGHAVSYTTLARLGLIGMVLSGGLAAFLAVLLRRNRAFDEAARIRARYGHLLVPILVGEDLGWPPVDVTGFKALVRLAESSGQLILHHQADAVDTYLVNDNGTVYRYQISLPLVTWGEWTETNITADPAALAQAATALAEAAAPAEAATTAEAATQAAQAAQADAAPRA
ncbi:MAG TPA: signal peptidase I [Solirubrobacteraceae bacterium]